MFLILVSLSSAQDIWSPSDSKVNYTFASDYDIDSVKISNESFIINDTFNHTIIANRFINITVISTGTYYDLIEYYDNQGFPNLDQSRHELTLYYGSYNLTNNSAPAKPTLISPANNSYDDDGIITFGFTTTDTRYSTITYYVYFDGAFAGKTTTNTLQITTLSNAVHNWSVQADDGIVNSTMSDTWYVEVGPPTSGPVGGGPTGGGGPSSDNDEDETLPVQQVSISASGNLSMKVLNYDKNWLTSDIVDLSVITFVNNNQSYVDRVWVELTQADAIIYSENLIEDEVHTGVYSYARVGLAPVGTYTGYVKAKLGDSQVSYNLGAIEVITPKSVASANFFKAMNESSKAIRFIKEHPWILVTIAAFIIFVIALIIVSITDRSKPGYQNG